MEDREVEVEQVEQINGVARGLEGLLQVQRYIMALTAVAHAGGDDGDVGHGAKVRTLVEPMYLDLSSSCHKVTRALIPCDEWNRRPFNMIFILNSVLSVTATSNCYKVSTGPNGEVINRWIPVPPDKIEMPFSVHLRDNFQVGVEEIPTDPGLRLYPNPASNLLTLAWEEEARSITVHDAQGRIVFDAVRLPASQRQHQINVEGWAAGLYTLLLNGSSKRLVERFAKY